MYRVSSPDNSDSGIERLIQAMGLNAPRVTVANIQANILSEHYFTAAEGVTGEIVEGNRSLDQEGLTGDHPLRLLTFCVLVLRNGFTVTGESSCASPENFNADIGKRIARANAEQKIWPLMGYALKERLHAKTQGVSA